MSSHAALGVGVIGCGTIAYWKHLRSLKSLRNVWVAGLTDPDPDALARARKLIDAPVFTEVDGLLASPNIDAVIIASPPVLHAGQIAAACTAGKHVYLEKPLAQDSDALSEIRTHVRDTSLNIALGFNYRFHPACQELRTRMTMEAIGDIRAIFSHFVEPVKVENMPVWKRLRAAGGGVLLDLASHHIDLYRWLLQDEFAQITADTHSRFSEQDSAHIRATTSRGIELGGYFAFTSSRSQRLTVHGTRGVLQLDMHSGVIKMETNRRHGYGVNNHVLRGGWADLAWRSRKLVRPSYDPSYRLALSAFVDSIANPALRHADLATLDDGAAALQAVLDAEVGCGHLKGKP